MLLSVLLSATLFCGAFAGPVELETRRLAKRDDGFHFLDCVNYSTIHYCPNVDDCYHGPADGDTCLPIPAGLHDWTSGEGTCSFPGSHGTLTWRLHDDAEQWDKGDRVGEADNGFNEYDIFRNDGELIYSDGHGNECRSWYYLLPA